MITVRQIEKLWTAKAYDKLLDQLFSPRPEASEQLLTSLTGMLPAAAMAVIRLDELSQPFVSLYGQLVQTILKSQRPDGGWGDVITTALCLRALLCGNGNGDAVDQGLACLAGLQKPEGIWPSIATRRMPADAFASAFVLLRLGDNQKFCESIDLPSALQWFETNDFALDDQTRRLWSHAKRRVPIQRSPRRLGAAKPAPVASKFWDLVPALSA